MTALLSVVLTTAACGSASGPVSRSAAPVASVPAPASIARAGALVFCTDATFPPFEFKDGARIIGLDVDLGTDLAGRLGVVPEFAQTGFDAIIASLRSGRCDAILAGMTVSPEREQQVDFIPYALSGQSILLPTGAENGVQTIDDLAGKSVAAQTGSVNAPRLKQASDRLVAAGKQPIDVVSFPGNTEAASALRTGKVDAFVSDYPSLAYLARQSPDQFVVVDTQTDVEPLGIAVDKQRGDVRDALTAALAQAYREGAVTAILDKWQVPHLALPQDRRPQ